jgi:cyclopropane fatty-acyl-phospholipid synthase-like methyltransferase
MLEKIRLIPKFLLDKRFRHDYRAMQYAADGYIHYAVDLLDDIGVLDILHEEKTISDIRESTGIQNKKMLEHMLSILSNEGILHRSNGKYILNDTDDPFSDHKLQYLEEQYPHSVDWTMFLLDHAEDVLLTGEPIDEAGFEGTDFLKLWDKMMEESPYSFKKMMVEKTLSDIDDGDTILDLGCGSGSLIEMVLRHVKDKEIHIKGIDASQDSLNMLQERLQELQSLTSSDIVKRNIDNVVLEQRDLRTSFPTDGQYDYIVASLLFNHIPPTERESFIAKMDNILTSGGQIGIYQFVHPSRKERLPFWLLHCVPTHHGHPFRDEFIPLLKSRFNNVTTRLKDSVIIATD